MDTSRVTRVEVIDHTRDDESGGGRAYTYWHGYDVMDWADAEVTVQLQDDGRTLKVFISPPKKSV